MIRDHTSSASAICGMDRGWTNETASIRSNPVAERASMSATLPSVGTGSSFWSPSRGPTSRRLIRSGSSLIDAGHAPVSGSVAGPCRAPLLVERRDTLSSIPAEGGRPPPGVFHLQAGRQWEVEPDPHGLLRISNPDRRVAGDRCCEFESSLARGAWWNEPVGEAEPVSLFGVDPSCREDKVGGPAPPDPSSEQLSATTARDHADGHLRQPEHGGLAGDGDGAGGGGLPPAAQGVAVHGRDDGHRELEAPAVGGTGNRALP